MIDLTEYLNVPGKTRQAWDRVDAASHRAKHPALLFYRYMGRIQASDASGDPKTAILEETARALSRTYGISFVEALRNRTEALWAVWHTLSFEGILTSRMVIGLGQKSPLEVGFRFHWLYGIPIIPGSALKGVARAYAELIEKVPEKDQESQETFFKIFGHPPKGEDEGGETGHVIFFDAIPIQQVRLSMDVMTPHYPEYYQGSQPPGNWQDPIPIPFLTVAPKTVFLFGIGWRQRRLSDEGNGLLATAAAWLKQGLSTLGIGAKTTSGYGRFFFPEPEGPIAEHGLEAEEQWRSGTVKHFDPTKGRGTVIDDETKHQIPFSRDAIQDKGWSPGRKAKVEFVLDKSGKRIIRVRRKGSR